MVQCIEMKIFYIRYCLPMPTTTCTIGQPSSPRSSDSLYHLVASITSKTLEQICIVLDTSYTIEDTDPLQLIMLANKFFDEQQSTHLDAMLADPRRYKSLEAVGVHLEGSPSFMHGNRKPS
ncbi:hypothetical protein DAEQUDRAFT_132951 [Daedalea quercina L-15889]|uniref:Uncharacterized protein n=1 Tax=Daedalea quercina L-15889 TaxID=1314783 RepID=A0A165KPV5_9APHY|nr:hypothetical protein DAEQUDRAFT_132951 [Daedalea quercina L-15889]